MSLFKTIIKMSLVLLLGAGVILLAGCTSFAPTIQAGIKLVPKKVIISDLDVIYTQPVFDEDSPVGQPAKEFWTEILPLLNKATPEVFNAVGVTARVTLPPTGSPLRLPSDVKPYVMIISMPSAMLVRWMSSFKLDIVIVETSTHQPVWKTTSRMFVGDLSKEKYCRLFVTEIAQKMTDSGLLIKHAP